MLREMLRSNNLILCFHRFQLLFQFNTHNIAGHDKINIYLQIVLKY